MTDLFDLQLGAHTLPDDPDAREGWQISDDDTAAWALRKVAAAEAEIVRVRALADAEIARVQAFVEEACTAPNHDIDWFKAKLIDYRRRLERDRPGLAQTYRLPSGVLKRAKNPDKVVVADPVAFIEWAQENAPDCLSTVPVVSAIKASPLLQHAPVDADARDVEVSMVAGDGEVVPGVVWQVGADRYDVKPNTDG